MKIGTVTGIGVHIHWTFWILILAYLLSVSSSFGLGAGLMGLAFVFSVFGCVLAHEFGHAWAAAYYGIPTVDITLLPIGGLARLQRLPDTPGQELVIALAGPAANLLIVAGIVGLQLCGLVIQGTAPALGTSMLFLDQLLVANLFLFVFNLLPAFPMDGGRVLRGLLEMRSNHLRATQIAARVGRWMALLFAIIAVTRGPLSLLLIAAFIVVAGTLELLGAHARAATDPTATDNQGPFRQFPFGAHTNVNWHTRVWPQHHPHADQSPRDASASEVIDAVDVKKIPD